MTELEIVYKDPQELVAYEMNSRQHSEEQIEQIAASIMEFGFTNPVLIDGANGIIAGHGRVLAAIKLTHEFIPTITLDGLSDEQKKAYVIADNQLALNGKWDKDILKMELDLLQKSGFDLGIIGFDEAELADFMFEDPPPKDFKEFDENIDTEHRCPKCGYEWSGKVA
jgi:ParB-like chromosome segregation protein Spo0J